MMVAWLVLTASCWAAGKTFTIVIDAGHGGRDAGCVGAISKEKDLTLKMALAVGKFLDRNCPNVKVIYTRKTDVFLELWQRAEIANKNKADLFLSIHINALPGGKVARGYQTYTLGQGRVSGSKRGISENLEVAKRENAVVVMEKDYRTHYAGFDPNSQESNIMFEFIQDTHMEHSVELAKLMQRYVCAATGRQNGGAFQDNLAVLRLTSMPGCLLELGFISTPDEERFLNSEEAPERYARGIFNAIISYQKKYLGGTSVPFAEVKPMEEPKPTVKETAPVTVNKPEPAQVSKPEPAPVSKSEPAPVVPEKKKEKAADGEAPVFKVQILTSDKLMKSNDPRLKGQADVDYYQEKGIYKYTVGQSADYQEIYQLRKTVLAKFPEAFIIAFRNGEKMNVQEAIKEYKAKKR